MNQYNTMLEFCKLCKKPLARTYRQTYAAKHDIDLVRVRTDLFGKKFDEVFHEKCWDKLKIYCG